MLRFIVTIIEIVLCYLLQSSVFSYFAISGVVPNCLLILVISVAYTRGQNSAMAVGFLSGIVLDLLFSETVGICALLYVLIAFLAGFLNRIYNSHDFIIPAALIFSGEIVYSVLYYITHFLLMGKLEVGLYIMNTIIPRAIYTFITALLLYPLLLYIHKFMLYAEGATNER